MIEVNISCPNVEDRGQVFACDPDAASAVIHAVRAQHRARHADLRQALARRHRHRRDRPGLRRRRRQRAVDDQHHARHGHRHDHAAAGAGRRHRRAVRPGHPADRGALRLAGARGACPRCRILGMGGIRTGLDALQFLAAGASAVSVGTVVFNDPSAPTRIHDELAAALSGARHRPAADVDRRGPPRRRRSSWPRVPTRSATTARSRT